MREQGLKLVVPLVTQGELIGLLNLGPRLQPSRTTRATTASCSTTWPRRPRRPSGSRSSSASSRPRPATRERIEQELQVAQLIQQNFLPKTTPDARRVGGRRVLPAGARGRRRLLRLHRAARRAHSASSIGDVTDKGVPAALVMADDPQHPARRRAAPDRPGEVLARANDLLCPDMPPNMFVTCLYAVLDPATGHLRFANAGHNLPYSAARRRRRELRATGMPLGLLPGMTYDERRRRSAPGDSVLLYSDGVVEAHNPHGEMFGFPRLRERMAAHRGGAT